MGYLLTVHVMMSPVLNGFLPESCGLSDPIFTIILAVPLLLPLSLLQDVSKLSFVSTVKIVVLMSTLVIIMISTQRTTVPDSAIEQPVGWRKLGHAKYLYNPRFFTRIGTLVMGFGTIVPMFSVYNTLETPSSKTMKTTNKIGLSFIWVVSILFPVVCSMGLGTGIPTNILDPGHNDSMMSKVMQIAYGIVLLLTHPILCIISREYIESIVSQCLKGEVDLEDAREEKGEVSRQMSVAITLILMATHLPFLFLGDAGQLASDMIDIIGGLATTSLSFVFPSILFWKVFGWRDETGKRSCKDRVLPLLILVFGLMAVVACPTMRVLQMCGAMGNSECAVEPVP